jgi:hypothetical protein
MIFASDLDQTLIYSLRALGDNFDKNGLVPAEIKDGATTAYIDIEALMLLQELAAQMLVVPVTTRTVEQYRRIRIFQDLIRPSYAVTSNGGNLLIDGVPDPDWNREIGQRIGRECASNDEVLRLFREIATTEWVTAERLCDGLFYSMLIRRDQMPGDDVDRLSERLDTLGWETSVQGRKLYLVPRAVSKGEAVRRLSERVQRPVLLASGDSLLDRSLLDAAQHAVAPRHGELYRQHLATGAYAGYRFTEASGAQAATEIVGIVADLLRQQAARIENW